MALSSNNIQARRTELYLIQRLSLKTLYLIQRLSLKTLNPPQEYKPKENMFNHSTNERLDLIACFSP